MFPVSTKRSPWSQDRHQKLYVALEWDKTPGNQSSLVLHTSAGQNYENCFLGSLPTEIIDIS